MNKTTKIFQIQKATDTCFKSFNITFNTYLLNTFVTTVTESFEQKMFFMLLLNPDKVLNLISNDNRVV